jgi:UDP-N-acetylmuramate dehydrogenase
MMELANNLMSHETDTVQVLYDEPMARHTSWRAGGHARRFVSGGSLQALSAFLSELPADEALLWVGLGSNLLVRDAGFDGTVIATQGVMNRLEMLDETHVYAGAGVADAKLARFCKQHGLKGAEFFAGIPGLVGGALAMNAGAWGGETWPLVESVVTIDRQGVIRSRNADEFEIGYRHVSGPDGEWFAGAIFEFEIMRDNQQTIDIKQLLAKRAATQPTGVASCGSVFRNPEGTYAAQLIESCGLKGRRIGGAVISDKHANFIINDKQATAADIESLIRLIQETVKQQCGIELQTEVRIVGDEAAEDTANDTERGESSDG